MSKNHIKKKGLPALKEPENMQDGKTKVIAAIPKQKNRKDTSVVKPKSRGKKDERIEFIMEKIAEGFSNLQLLKSLREEFLIGRVQALKDIADAENLLKLLSEPSEDSSNHIRSLALRDTIIMKAMAKDDFRIALSALDAREKLLGINTKENITLEQAIKNIQEVAELAYNNDIE